VKPHPELGSGCAHIYIYIDSTRQGWPIVMDGYETRCIRVADTGHP
jgi:hypothetical protein